MPGTPAAPDPLQRVEMMLREVLRLTRDVIDMKRMWSATPDDSRLLMEVASFTGQALPLETFRSEKAALEFLLMAKLSLEARAKSMKDAPPS
ncbi:MAG: hypothetical protein ACLQDQ_05470 [Myxococcaceae bacterium]